jgi:hypothetical protein
VLAPCHVWRFAFSQENGGFVFNEASSLTGDRSV